MPPHRPATAPPRASRAAIEWWLLAAVLTTLVVVLAHLNREPSGRAVSRIDAAIYDLGLQLWARPPRDEVTIVAIDDDSLAQVGRWPWRRAVAALLLERLQAAGPRAIGVDVLFSEPAIDDALLERALDGPVPVVLPVARERTSDGRELPVMPVPRLGAGRALAHVEFPTDADGMIRGLYLHEAGLPAMALRLSRIGQSDDGAALPTVAAALAGGAWTRTDYVRLGASSAPARRVSAAAVMRGEVDPALLRDRIVLVGATARGLGDTHATTLNVNDAVVSGIELHAAAVSAILDGRLLREPPHALRLAAFAAVVLAVLAVLYATEPRTGLGCVVSAMLATAGLTLLAVGAGWWLAPGALLVALALSFPLWSWRRLHAASVGLIAQASRLEEDATPGPARRVPIEPIAQRLQRLEDAADRIRELNRSLADTLETLRVAQRERDQTLRFLSHDLRAPHLSILAQLERAAGGPLSPEDARAIGRQSSRALELTDGFMQLARAESQPLRREPVDLADLAVEAADACWQRAEARGLRIAGPAIEPGVAVCACDATLVRRALVNLLDNALRHAPPGSQVDLGLERDGAGWRLSVSDRGPGVDPADRTRIFEPWWRGRDADPSTGVGLGLAFVATVAERHGGAARALGHDGGGARIELWLPDGVEPAPSE